jgi:hypothetical protein
LVDFCTETEVAISTPYLKAFPIVSLREDGGLCVNNLMRSAADA